MGWVYERGSSYDWQPYFLVLTQQYLIFMKSAPNNSEDINKAVFRYEVIHLNMKAVQPENIFDPNRPICFLLIKPESSSFINLESKSEMQSWQKAIQVSTNASFSKIAVRYSSFINQAINV
jgi:hypothetical protein